MAQKNMVVERRAIDFVPDEERHGKARSMFTLFFSGNMQITAIATGIIPITMGLGFGWSLFVIVVGNLLGGFVMALHAVQGPRIGIPQMIQCRAQFGVLGANFPLALVVLMYLGFFAGSSILGGEALSSIFGIPDTPAIALTNIAIFLLFLFGHDAIHRFARWTSAFFTVVFIAGTVLVLIKMGALPGGLPAGKITVPTLLIAISIFVGWQVTYGPYVADYSRYLPKETPAHVVFLNTYFGSVIGSIWAMLVGLFLGVVSMKLASANPTVAFTDLFGSMQWVRIIVLLAVFAGVIVANSFNLYGGCLSSLSILSSNAAFSDSVLRHGRRYRVSLGVIGIIIAALISILGANSIMAYLNNLLLILVYVFIPWSAINLTDFFLVRHGEYVLADIYNRNGRYGVVGVPALVSFVLAILVEIPFMSMPFFTGPIANAMGGTDITWIVGLIVGCGAYYALERSALKHAGVKVGGEQRDKGPAF